ncbi:hypothetical protein VII00023_15476 [Vibrio ichthyoenteri ATCC 700023]|uniref:NERD domain-containing protein n=1 Tax=Vibrio ichthyoenteri ATCC 700023 TaxID=870968 RepID=F9S233_9VIBR|nr:nuclease-related domain-containing protein [Vibrio ichthyoenteri]EGU40192.1 hypothetical protein VII00023_15476 [Vibrio ichthyoenteri ATCC 700023]
MRIKKIALATIIGLVLTGPIGAFAIAVIAFLLTKKDNTPPKESASSHWHIPDISDLNPLNSSEYKRKEAGNHGEKLMKTTLQELKGNVINGYITTENMVFNNKNFEIDFLVLAPHVGLVVVEVKHYSGKVYCSDDKNWHQINSQGIKKSYKNASLQSLRTKSLLSEILTSENINNWPLSSVVVFTHPTANIYKQKGTKSPQTEILIRNTFKGWLNEQEKHDDVIFSIDDFNKIRNLLKSTEHEYSGARF